MWSEKGKKKRKGENLPLPSQKKRGILQELYKHKTLYAMTLPALIFFLIFSYIPMLGVYYAFVDYDFAKGIFHSPFVGLKKLPILHIRRLGCAGSISDKKYNSV